MIEQKGMTFDHDFGYSFHLSYSLLKKKGREKENEVKKIVIKSHVFLLDPFNVIRNTLLLFSIEILKLKVSAELLYNSKGRY